MMTMMSQRISKVELSTMYDIDSSLWEIEITMPTLALFIVNNFIIFSKFSLLVAFILSHSREFE